MPIEVKHGVNPAAFLQAAFVSGQGVAQSGGGVPPRGGSAINSGKMAYDLARQQANAQSQQAAQANQYQQDNMRLNALLQDSLAGAAQGRRQQDFAFEYTTKQRADLEQLANAEAQAMASPDFTDADKAEIRRRFVAKRAGIQPVEQPRELTPAEQFRQATHTDQKTGLIYPLIRKDGAITFGKPLNNPPEREMTWKDRNAVFSSALKFAEDPETKVVDQNRLEYYLDKIRQYGAGDAGVGGAEPAPGGAEPAPGGAEPAPGGVEPAPGGAEDDWMARMSSQRAKLESAAGKLPDGPQRAMLQGLVGQIDNSMLKRRAQILMNDSGPEPAPGGAEPAPQGASEDYDWKLHDARQELIRLRRADGITPKRAAELDHQVSRLGDALWGQRLARDEELSALFAKKPSGSDEISKINDDIYRRELELYADDLGIPPMIEGDPFLMEISKRAKRLYAIKSGRGAGEYLNYAEISEKEGIIRSGVAKHLLQKQKPEEFYQQGRDNGY